MTRSLLIFSLSILLILTQIEVYSAQFGPGLLKNRKIGSGTGVQQLVRTLGGTSTDITRSVAVDTSGNFYVAGTYFNTTANANSVSDFSGAALNGKTTTASTDVFVAKFNSSGTQQWIRTLGGTSTESMNSVAVDYSGNVYVAGNSFNSSTNANSVTDFSGATLNGKTATASNDGFVAKLDASGAQQWIRTIGGTNSDISNNVKVDSVGNVYATGAYRNSDLNANSVTDFNGATLNGKSAGSNNDGYVVKFDSAGNQTWIKTLGGGSSDFVNSVAVDLTGNVYTAGQFVNSATDSAAVTDFNNTTLNGKSTTSLQDVFVAKLNSTGTQQWVRALGGEDIDVGQGVSADENGNVYVSGYFNNSNINFNIVTDFSGATLNGKSGTAANDGFVAKLNSAGTQQWIRTIGGTGDDKVLSVTVDGLGNIFVSGEYSNSSGNGSGVTDFSGVAFNGKTGTVAFDAYVARLNHLGTQQWILALGGTGADSAATVVVDHDGFVYASGYYTNTTANASSVTDFGGTALNGKTTTSSSDGWVVKIY